MSLDTPAIGAVGPRELSDPRAIRALAHPTRLRLLEIAADEGTITATRASEIVGESVPSCSFHLRQLAKYGFVERAEGGVGRERPYRRTSMGHRWSRVSTNPEAARAARLLSSVLLEQELARLVRWWERSSADPPEWREAAQGKEAVLYLTAEELVEFGERLEELIARNPLTERSARAEARPPGARPIKVLAFAYPFRPGANAAPSGAPSEAAPD
ncbi:MAG: winged helix-turn-helix domain-containing protein [Actinomycetota bacterium]|nr:winged helix-turn-helix domain-containing protein [Actinomycetota bacterium]